ESARVEKALRDSAELRARLEAVRNGRTDGRVHILGAIRNRSRGLEHSGPQLSDLPGSAPRPNSPPVSTATRLLARRSPWTSITLIPLRVAEPALPAPVTPS